MSNKFTIPPVNRVELRLKLFGADRIMNGLYIPVSGVMLKCLVKYFSSSRVFQPYQYKPNLNMLEEVSVSTLERDDFYASGHLVILPRVKPQAFQRYKLVNNEHYYISSNRVKISYDIDISTETYRDSDSLVKVAWMCRSLMMNCLCNPRNYTDNPIT